MSELCIEQIFDVAREGIAIAIPPDLLHSRQAVRGYILDPNHLVEPKTSMGPADSAGLNAAVRSFADPEAGNGVVHHDRARIDAIRQSLATCAIAGPDAGGKATLGIVGQADCLVLVVKR